MRLSRLFAVLVGALAIGACTDTETVYVTRPPFNPPVDSVNGFLGYYDVSTKQTSCGNCHVEHQANWKATLHASAWENLMALAQPADKSSCVGCHTVSENGNLAPAPAGYNAKPDSAYHDVQCESCHGGGFDHASVPDAGNGPLASIHVDTTKSPANDSVAAVLAAGSCAACHQDTHHPFWEEWRQSMHANMGRHNDEEYCLQCHSGQGALEAWGVTAAYKEEGAVNEGITCAVCHNPHSDANTAQLRWPLETTNPDQQICMKCHNRRTAPQILDSLANPVQGGSNSPHAPQGAVLLAYAGYQNANYLDPVILQASSHGNLTKNPALCAGCHLYGFPDTNDAGVVVNRTGHLFRPIPCYGPDGLATDTIRNCGYTPTERSFKSCATAPCHGDENTAAALLSVARGRIQTLTAALWVNSNFGSSATNGIDTLDGGIIPAILKNTYSQRGNVNNLSLQVKGAAALGDTIVNLGATTVTGRLAPSNTFKIAGDGTTYTVQNTVTAAANLLTGVIIKPALVKAAANNAAVTVMYLGPLYAGDRTVTAADGAEFNTRMFGEDASGVFMPGAGAGPSSTADRSHTVHNPFFAEAMLRANVDELTDLYGSQPWFPVLPPAVKQILASPLGPNGTTPSRPASRVSSR